MPLAFLAFGNQFPAQIRTARVHQEPSANCFTPQEHPESHGVASRERKIDQPALASELQRGPNNRTILTVTAGALDVSVLVKLCDAAYSGLRLTLHRVHCEAHEVAPPSREDLDVVRVERGAARTCIDLHLDSGDVELRQGYPLTPAYDPEIAHVYERDLPRCESQKRAFGVRR